MSDLEIVWTKVDEAPGLATYSLLPIVEACVIDRDLFASELVIRASRAGLHVLEIPIRLHEKRPPAINLTKRVPHVLRGLAKLTYVIRFGGKP